MRPISFVICAAGKGERFRQNGLNISKPKIKLNGISMLERSLSALEHTSQDEIIVIGQKEDQLEKYFGHLANVIFLNIQGQTRGQLETFLKAENLISHDDVVVFNCDTYFTCKGLRSIIESGEYEGIIPCSIQPGTSWSFCEVDSENIILRVTEKVRISEWASVGYYYFKRKDLLFKFAKQELESLHSEEYYVAPLYNRYLKDKFVLKMVPVDSFLPFGTLDQVHNYWSVSVAELLKENS